MSSVLCPRQHSIGRFLQVKRPNEQYQSTEGDATKKKEKTKTTKYIYPQTIIYTHKDIHN